MLCYVFMCRFRLNPILLSHLYDITLIWQPQALYNILDITIGDSTQDSNLNNK